ncbi:MAG: PDZ domain-containing protein [Planctomycetales bacterium]|nr:PDZ domain-containing protein [Planctomycetales bacterium]
MDSRRRITVLVALSVVLSVLCIRQLISERPRFPDPFLVATDTEEASTKPMSSRLWRRYSRSRPAMQIGKNHEQVREAFVDVVAGANPATVQIMHDDKAVALGTVVDSGGLILTKASELPKEIMCRIPGGLRREGKVVASDEDYDLALVQVEAPPLTPAEWSTENAPAVGSWLAAPSGFTDDPLSVGVVSVPPRRIRPESGVLGIWLDDSDNGPRVTHVIDGSGAEVAGIRVDDIIRRIDGDLIDSREKLTSTIRKRRPGEQVWLDVMRATESIRVQANLTRYSDLVPDEEVMQNTIGGPISERRSGFSEVIQHDSLIQPHHCGGPIVDLEGHVVGINIARAGRTATYALPSHVVRERLDLMRAQLNP